MFALGKSRRKIASTNIRRCFPELDEQQQQALLRRTFAHLGTMIVDMGTSWFASPAKLKGMGRFDGLENLEAILDNHGGALILMTHQTAMEIGGQILAQWLAERGTPLVVMYKKTSGDFMETLVQRGRYRFTEKTIHHNNMRGLLRSLKDGAPVWYAPDQDFGPRRSIFARFFDIPTATIPMTHKLVESTGVPLVTCNVYRDESDGCINISLSPPVDNFPSGDPQADTQRVNDLHEAIIREHPEQYFWVHRRFKTRLEGEPPFY